MDLNAEPAKGFDVDGPDEACTDHRRAEVASD
jgi:hypothetical protein